MPSRASYRPDIDGLRAVAILAVVAFHAFPRALPGGFVGVDVFFVISGFLISGIIFDALDRDRFSFTEFYVRRVRRLFPALTVVLIASLAAGWWLLLPSEYRQLGKHSAAGVGFAANLLYWQEAGYFDAQAEAKPLLHLWSLGIEEQFYLVWPAFLVLVVRQGWPLLRVVATICAASLVLSLWLSYTETAAAFYSPMSRLWELALGSACARLARPSGSTVRESLAWLGAGLVALAIAVTDARGFPGLWALLPTFGTALLILAGPDAWVNRYLLSARLMVGVGLISYPLYLWHWPLLTFARLAVLEMTVSRLLLTLALSVVFAVLTFRFVEAPIRVTSARRGGVLVLSIPMVLCAAWGATAYHREGFPSRFSGEVASIAAFAFDLTVPYRLGTCFLKDGQTAADFAPACVESATADRPARIALWGDSHAAHLYPGLRAVFGPTHALAQWTTSGCPPILEFDFPLQPECRDINTYVLKQLRETKPDRVWLAANWTAYDLGSLAETVRAVVALGVAVDFIGPVPQWREGLPRNLLAFYQQEQITIHRFPERVNFGRQTEFPLDARLRSLAERESARYISPIDLLCNEVGCVARLSASADSLTAFDRAHLTTAGSEFLVARFPK